MSHTPEPWIWERLPDQGHPTVPEWTLKGPDVLCRFWHDKPLSDDACTIAAAPALLAACEAALPEVHFALRSTGPTVGSRADEVVAQLKAAIDLAKPPGVAAEKGGPDRAPWAAIGNVLDRWDQLPNDIKTDPGCDELTAAISQLHTAIKAAEKGA